MYSEILIRFGELSLKGKNKMSFVRKLEKNIIKLAGVNPRVEFDRMFIEYSDENMKKLQYIFGIYSYSPVAKCKPVMKDIEELSLKVMQDANPKTFKVETKRANKDFPIPSQEMSKNIGGYVLQNIEELSVDVKNPEIKLEIEVRRDFAFVFAKRIKGLGGLPTGINGKVLHLMSGGIDSPVAAFQMMKRGIHVDFLNFITPPHTDAKTIDKVNRLVKLLIKYQGPARLYTSNYTDLMNLIGLTSNQAYKINLMRRSFYRIANKIAARDHYLGLANGENLGQVASQTLESIDTIASQVDLPIYRPVLTRDKLETIAEAKKIGTYEISIEKANEACELFAPKAPVTKPTRFEAEKLEKELSEILDLEKENIQHLIEIKKIEI